MSVLIEKNLKNLKFSPAVLAHGSNIFFCSHERLVRNCERGSSKINVFSCPRSLIVNKMGRHNESLPEIT